MYLIFISKTNLELFKNHQKVHQISWNKDDLSQIFCQLKNNFSSRFRVLLSDEFINTVSLSISSKESKKRNLIQSQAQSLVTQDLSQTIWDYKIIARQGKQRLIQVSAVSKDFFDIFRQAISTSKIKVGQFDNRVSPAE